jgi:hypothetical protein
MAYNDKRLKTDLEGKPIPQAYNPDIDDYEPVHSTNNALNQVIYGPNGQPISTVGNKLAVRATELEALMQGLATEGKLEQVRQLLSGVATENKLEQARALLEAISTKDFATSSKQDALNIAVEDLKSELILVKSELANIKANQLSGDQKVQLSGTITAEDIEGNPIALSAEKDPDGKAVLRIVDAAPFAYNKETDRFMVETETTTIETLMNAVSVPAQGGISQVMVDFTSEQEAWFFLSVDKQPWRLHANPVYTGSGNFSQMFFPDVGASQTTVHTINIPLSLLFLPTRPDPAPSSLEEARLYPLTPGKMLYKFVFTNLSDEIATVTLKLLRVRR